MCLSVSVCVEVCVGDRLVLLVDASHVEADNSGGYDVNKLSVSVTAPRPSTSTTSDTTSASAVEVTTEAASGTDVGRQLYKCCYTPVVEGTLHYIKNF